MPRSQTDFYARLRDGKELSRMVSGSMVRGKEMRNRFFDRVRGEDLGGRGWIVWVATPTFYGSKK